MVSSILLSIIEFLEGFSRVTCCSLTLTDVMSIFVLRLVHGYTTTTHVITIDWKIYKNSEIKLHCLNDVHPLFCKLLRLRVGRVVWKKEFFHTRQHRISHNMYWRQQGEVKQLTWTSQVNISSGKLITHLNAKTTWPNMGNYLKCKTKEKRSVIHKTQYLILHHLHKP